MTSEPPLSVSAAADVARVLAIAALTGIATWMGHSLTDLPASPVAAAWPAVGVALAGVLLVGSRIWPAIALGVLVAEIVRLNATSGTFVEFIAVVSTAAAIALQAVVAASLFRTMVGTNDPFRRARDAGLFVVLTAILGCGIVPTVSASAAAMMGELPWDRWSERWLEVWFANHNGVLLAAPLVLAWSWGNRTHLGPWQGPEMILLACAPAIVCLAVRHTGYPLEYLYLPMLAWSAFRFGVRGSTAMLVGVGALAVAATANGYGSFHGETPALTRFLLSSFIGTIGASTLVLLGVIAQRDAAEHGLADAHALLENRVRIRTQELAAANGRLKRIADLDGLTGVPNRRFFNTALETEWRRATYGGRSVAVILLDVDYFKAFNDSYGHPAGDACLQAIADALSSGLQRGGELLARYGGEEFVALLPHADVTDALRAAERLRERVAKLAIKHSVPTESATVTLSAGVAAEIPARGRTSTDLLAAADAALYSAKRNGRNRVEIAAKVVWSLDG
jgi:diguanylate cyclase (GGDEF)-like protein